MVNVLSSIFSIFNDLSGFLATSTRAPDTSRPVPVSCRLRIAASALNGVPSVNEIPWRSLIVHCVESAFGVMLSASTPCTLLSVPRATSGS